VYKEIDVMAPEGKSWRDYYEFDTPVVGPECLSKSLKSNIMKIHVSSSTKNQEVPELVSEAKKLMHRFTTEEVMAKMDEVEKENHPSDQAT
jgi:hypothetical protein